MGRTPKCHRYLLTNHWLFNQLYDFWKSYFWQSYWFPFYITKVESRLFLIHLMLKGRENERERERKKEREKHNRKRKVLLLSSDHLTNTSPKCCGTFHPTIRKKQLKYSFFQSRSPLKRRKVIKYYNQCCLLQTRS